MNKILRYSFVALLAMVFGNISAENVIWQEDWSSWGDYVKKVLDGVNPNYVFEGTATNEDGSFKSGTTIYNEKLAGGEAPELLVAKNGGKFIATVNLGGNSGDMTLSFKCNKNIPVEVSGGTIGENTGSGNDYSYAITGASGTLTITFNNSLSANARLDDIKLFQGQGKKAAGLSWGTSSRTVTIGADDNVFPTLQNENNLAVTYSSSDQTVATIASDGTITLIAAGKTTIKAESAETDEFEAGKAEYELTVNEATTPGEETTVANVAALNALENNTKFTYTGDVLVVYVNGSYAYIKDDTGSSLIYDNGKTKLANLGIGTKVAANWTGKVSVYNNLFEAVPDDVLATNGASAIQVTYPDAAITDVVAANMNQVVVLKGVAYTAPEGKNFTISQGGVDVAGYNTFGIEIAAPEEGKTYNITGVISVYKENAQFLPIAIEEVVTSTDTWTVAGTKPLVDIVWDPTDTNADMTSTDGVTFTYVKEDITLEAGVPNEFKIVKNHSWDEAYPSSNYTFSVDETAKYKVTITFNATSKEITVDKVKTGEAEVVTHTYSVVGTLVGSWEADQDMTKGDDGLYRVEIRDVEKGDYEYKVRADHDWSVSYPASGNYQLSIEQTSTVTITFNEETKEVLETVTPATGINTIDAAKAQNGAIYNVAGQKVNAGYKGLIIMNGKKFVNK
jgi:hypothetical protein